MSANKLISGMLLVSASMFVVAAANAVQGLDASGQTKVNGAMAKRWSEQAKGSAKTPTDEKRVVNYGSKKQGTCNVNVGTQQQPTRPGQRAPKDIVVTTKEVINVCK
ncbi:MAG: hypothetical protein PHV02_04260 [Rhodocyclaceae bacterium]|nr:hypothetical protein [Rhodocyclaceae bacterium]